MILNSHLDNLSDSTDSSVGPFALEVDNSFPEAAVRADNSVVLDDNFVEALGYIVGAGVGTFASVGVADGKFDKVDHLTEPGVEQELVAKEGLWTAFSSQCLSQPKGNCLKSAPTTFSPVQGRSVTSLIRYVYDDTTGTSINYNFFNKSSLKQHFTLILKS